jgi:Ca2+/Na+ antiporter
MLLWVNAIWILKSVLILIAGSWLLVVTSSILERNYSLDRPQAIATVVIPVVALFVMAAVMVGTTVLALAVFRSLL